MASLLAVGFGLLPLSFPSSLMTLFLAVGFGFLPLVVWLYCQVMSSLRLWIDASSCIRVCPGKLPLCNLTTSRAPALVAPQPFPSELLGPAYRGGISCVSIIRATITHQQNIPTGDQLKKSTHRQAFYYFIVTSLPQSPSRYNWIFLVAWLLSTTVTQCHPPSLTRGQFFPPGSEALCTVGCTRLPMYCSWHDSWTLLPIWLANTRSLLILFAFEEVEDICTQFSVNRFPPISSLVVY